jgi:Protein of unknown function (DUF3108)
MAFCAQAQAELLVSRYAVSLGGVRMGEAILHATIDAKHYKVEISADVGTLLNNTKVQGEASGSRTGQKLTPERYKLVMSDGQESSVDFAASAAAGANPGSSLKGVLDPLSALLAASIRSSATSPTPCDKVLTVLMSRAKINASFHPSQEEQQDPRLVTCRVQFASNPAVNGRQLQSVQWEVNFQKLNKPQLWLVEQVSLPTDLGTVTINRVETAVSGS